MGQEKDKQVKQVSRAGGAGCKRWSSPSSCGGRWA